MSQDLLFLALPVTHRMPTRKSLQGAFVKQASQPVILQDLAGKGQEGLVEGGCIIFFHPVLPFYRKAYTIADRNPNICSMPGLGSSFQWLTILTQD